MPPRKAAGPAQAAAASGEKQRVFVRTTLGTNLLVLLPANSTISRLKRASCAAAAAARLQPGVHCRCCCCCRAGSCEPPPAARPSPQSAAPALTPPARSPGPPCTQWRLPTYTWRSSQSRARWTAAV